MDFKIGDIIYCINLHYNVDKITSSLLTYINLNEPYEIKELTRTHIYIKGNSRPLCKERFISKNEYIKRIRVDKIKNILDNVKNDRKISK